MYNLFRIASVVVPRLPRWLVLALANAFGIAAWLIARKARKQVTANMVHVLGPEAPSTRAGRKRLRGTVRGVFQNSARNYLEMFSLPNRRPEWIASHMDIEGVEHLVAALALRRGVILFSAHFGPFDYLAQWFSAKGYQVTIPVERLKDQRLLDLVTKLRSSQGIHFVPLGDSAAVRSSILALRKNQLVVITADRAIEGESVVKPFFGEPARLPLGAVSLSLRTGAPLVGAFGWHASSKRVGGHFVPLSLELTEEERANPDTLMCGLIESMERYIKAHPEQWVVFAPIWANNSGKGQ